MFERFTDRARKVVVLAQEEARMLDHNYIGTEHLLLGLIHEGEGVAALVLQDSDVELPAMRRAVESIIGKGEQPPKGHIPFTPRAKKVLELSLREALHLRHDYIGTEHLLLGLLSEGSGVAAQVLTGAGLDLHAVRQRIVDRVGRGSRDRAGQLLFAASPQIGERLQHIQDNLVHIQGSLDRIERRLDAMGAPPDEQAAPGA